MSETLPPDPLTWDLFDRFERRLGDAVASKFDREMMADHRRYEAEKRRRIERTRRRWVFERAKSRQYRSDPLDSSP